MTTYEESRPNTPRNRGDYTAPHMSPVTPEEDIRSIMINQVTWGAVFSGVAIALVTQLVLNLIGFGIGFATTEPVAAGNWVIANLSVGTVIWWTLSGIVSAYAGGYAAGRLCGEPRESSAGWHGLTSWAASVLILSFLIVAGAGITMGGMMNTTGLRTNTAAGAIPFTTAQRETPPPVDSSTLEMRAQSLAQTEGIPLDEARQRVRLMEPSTNGYNAAPAAPSTTAAPRTTASNAANNAEMARIAAQGALLSAIALIFGALAAWFGGRAGAIQPTVTPDRTYIH